MPLISERALVLQAFPYSDTSKILRLFCVQHGVRSVIAKGALRPRSRFGGVLEPFTEGEAQFHLREGRDLHTLSGFDLLRSRQGIGRDLTAFSGASVMAELILRFGTEEPHPRLFHALSASLERLATGDAASAPAYALAGVWEIVALLGFEPQLAECVGCGRAIEPDEATRFDVEAGGVACTFCRPQGRVVDPSTRVEVQKMTRGEPPAAREGGWSLHRALLRAFVLTHLAPEHPLRSLDLFVAQMQ